MNKSLCLTLRGTYSTLETYQEDQELFEQNALHRFRLAFTYRGELREADIDEISSISPCFGPFRSHFDAIRRHFWLS